MSSASTATPSSNSASAFTRQATSAKISIESLPKLTGSENWKFWSEMMMQYFTIMGAKAHVDGTLKCASAAGQEQQDWGADAPCFIH